MSIYDKASLVLIPSGTKTSKVYSQVPTNGDGDFTFSRSTAATRVNASGNIEKETQNLFTYSNTFDNSAWSKSNVILTSGQAGYDGTNNAWKLIQNTSSGYHYIQQQVNAGLYTWSIYAKAGEYSNIGFYNKNLNDANVTSSFNLSTGTWTQKNHDEAVATSVGNGWYRISIPSRTSTSDSYRYYVNQSTMIGETGDGTSGIYIQSAQIEQGLVARDYIETTTTAIYGGITDNVPRLDYTDSSCPALLLEPQRTNLVTQSELFDGFFSLQAAAQIENNTTSPEGYQNALKMYPTATGTYKGYNKSFGSTLNNTAYTLSVYAKAAEFEHMFFYEIGAAGGTNGVWFNLATGNVGTTQSAWSNAKMTDMGDGWYRCEATLTYGGSADYWYILAADNDGSPVATASGTNGLYLYGAQMEEASYATSYIPTYGSAVTRAYENQDATGLSTSVFNNDDLTLFYDFDYNADGREGSTTAYRIFSGTSQLGIKGRSGSSRSVEIYSSGSFSGSIVFNNIANSSRIKVALRITNGTCELFFNGAKDTETIDVSGAAPYNWGQITMLASSSLNTSLNQCLGFPTALTDQELIDLTTL